MDAPYPPNSFSVRGFVVSEDAGRLDDREYDDMCRRLDEIEALVALREERFAAGEDGDGVDRPGNNWSPEKAQHGELDGAVTNPFTSYRLLQSRDRDILRKLRLYSQAFSGYQLATLAPNNTRPWIREKLPENYDTFLRMLVHWPDQIALRWLYLAGRVPGRLLLSPAPRLGEIGWLVNDIIVNRDTLDFLERLVLMDHNGVFAGLRAASAEDPVRILEIGGGYGGLAFFLMKLLGKVDYTIVDLPESLAFSYLYLSTLRPAVKHRLVATADQPIEATGAPGFTYVANFLADRLVVGARPFDLAINTLSMNEMTPEQIDHYGGRIAELLAPGAVFFDQNQDEPDETGMSPLDRILLKHFPDRRLCEMGPLPEIHRGRARLWRR